MKNLIISLSLAFVAFTICAQTPQALNYQAVARNNSGSPITNQLVGIRISILQGSINGSSVYTETHQTTTNQVGLLNIQIGSGTVQSGAFTSISWGTSTYFSKVEIDPNGGTNYQVLGTSQMLSVPYALYAKKVETESQILSITGNQLSISQGNTVTIPSSGGGSNLSIQEMPISNGTGGSPQVNDFVPTSVMTYSVGGNEVYIAMTQSNSNGSSSLQIIEFKKDISSGLYYKNKIIPAGGIQSGNIGGMTIFNGDIYLTVKTSFPQFTYVIRKINLTNNQATDLTFVGSTPATVGALYHDGNLFFIRNNSNTNWQKYQLSGNTLVDNGVAIINIPYTSKFAIFDGGEVLHFCAPDKFVKMNTSGNVISDNTIPVISSVDLNASMTLTGAMKINASLIYLVNVSSLIENAGGGNQYIFKLHLFPKTNP